MVNAVANGVAGAVGGMIAQIITYPLQSVNTRQQTERIPRNNRRIPDNKNRNAGTLAQILQVLQSDGLGGLYSGLKPSLLGTAVSQGIYYYFYQLLKNKAQSIALSRRDNGQGGDGSLGMFSWLLIAAIAGSFNVLLTNPIWVVVTRMQTNTQAEKSMMEAKKEALLRQFSQSSLSSDVLQQKLDEIDSNKPRPYGARHAVREVYEGAGIKGFWKGLVPTLIMVSNPSIQFMIYESSLKHLRNKRAAKNQDSNKVTALEVFLLGALAKLGATVSTYPLLVVKSRLQAKQEIGGNISLRYSGTIDAITKMMRFEGLSCFYKGMSTKIFQSVFAASVLFMLKEELVKAYVVLADKSHKVVTSLVK